MQIGDVLREAQGGRAIQNLANAFNIDPAQAETAISQILPQLAQRIERNTLSRGGVADLVQALGDQRFRSVLAQPKALASPAAIHIGNGALDTILGSKDTSRRMAERAAAASGLSETVVKQMLPVIASMLMGGLSQTSQAAFGDIARKIPGFSDGEDNPFALPSTTGGFGTSGGTILPGPLAGPRAGSGRPALPSPDDAQEQDIDPDRGPPSPAGRAGGRYSEGGQTSGRQAGNLPTGRGSSSGPFGGGPLPIPGDNIPGLPGGPQDGPGESPWGDLGDIIRKGGPAGGPGAGGDPISNMIRSVLGSLLGFKNKGFLGWLIQFIVLRWGLGFLKRILGRALGGR